MEAKIYISGRITKGETLIDVIRQYKSFENPTEVTVEINSNGGNKTEGDAIYDYLKNIDAEIPVTTKTQKAYSIAAKIFAAGSTRIVSDIDNVIGIHFARVTPEGDFTAEELQEITDQLFEIKTEFVDFYSEHLSIDKDTVDSLLENETILSGEKAVELEFATEVEKAVEIVAELNIEKSNLNKTEMDKKDKGQKVLDAMAEFLGITKNKKNKEIKAELTLQDSNATDIVFPDLESDATPSVGDGATMDGSAITDGSYVIPSLEEATYVFVDGKVSEIIPKEEETETTETETETEAATETEVKAEEIKEVFTYSATATNTSFEVGETLMFEGWDGGEDYAASAGEFRLKDGSKIVTDASGSIVSKEAAETANPTLEAEASFETLLEKVTAKVKEEISAEFEGKIATKEEEIKTLKTKIGSKEFKAEQKDVPEKKEKGSRAAEIVKAGRK